MHFFLYISKKKETHRKKHPCSQSNTGSKDVWQLTLLEVRSQTIDNPLHSEHIFGTHTDMDSLRFVHQVSLQLVSIQIHQT